MGRAGAVAWALGIGLAALAIPAAAVDDGVFDGVTLFQLYDANRVLRCQTYHRVILQVDLSTSGVVAIEPILVPVQSFGHPLLCGTQADKFLAWQDCVLEAGSELRCSWTEPCSSGTMRAALYFEPDGTLAYSFLDCAGFLRSIKGDVFPRL